MAPSHRLADFIQVCATGLGVGVSRTALSDAQVHFGLKTQGDLISFIGAGGLEEPQFINTKPWENNPNPEVVIMVDAYNFSSGCARGYIAFFFNRCPGKWWIKSFKRDADPSRGHAAFENLDKILADASIPQPTKREQGR